jgi:hypothetical protein
MSTDISHDINQEARVACLANHVGVDLCLTGKNPEALFHFGVAIELFKATQHGLYTEESSLLAQQGTYSCIFSVMKTQIQGETILLAAHVPFENHADGEKNNFLSLDMSYEWRVASTLVAIHNAVAVCKILNLPKQALSLIETAWALINRQDWSWEDVLLGKELAGGQSQTIRFVLVSMMYNRGRLFMKIFNKKLHEEQADQHSSLLSEELHNLLKKAVHAFSFIAASSQEKGSLLILQEQQQEGCRHYQEINLFLFAKAWSWLGYTLSLIGVSSSLVEHSYGVARSNYNTLCCITGHHKQQQCYCYFPTCAHDVAPSA